VDVLRVARRALAEASARGANGSKAGAESPILAAADLETALAKLAKQPEISQTT
jgi:hypothetical protein